MKLSRSFRAVLIMLICAQTGMMSIAQAQDCTGFAATATPYESRCTATGIINLVASGGSGNYNYKVSGPVSSGYTSSGYITGLAPGTYSADVKDIVTGCIIHKDSTIIIAGSYKDPRFGISENDVSCYNANDGTVYVSAVMYGRPQYVYTIVAPSTMGVGTSNSTGTFTGLAPGSYSIQLTDSCGGLQTRNVSVHNYTWSITSAPVTLKVCQDYTVSINLGDSRGNTNASGTAFGGFQYGYVNAPGDTMWTSNSTFDFYLDQRRTATFVVKDLCGNVQFKNWTNPKIPSVASAPTISNLTCATFDVTINGRTNLTNPTFCLTDATGVPVAGVSCNTSGIFTSIPYGSYCIQVNNYCYDTLIKRCFTQAKPAAAVSGAASLSNFTCTSFDAKVTGQQNLYNPTYCIVNSSNVQVQPCNKTGVFPGLAFGSYTITVTDSCSGQVFTIPFTGAEKTRSVAANVTMSGFTCSDFDVKVTGQSNLTNPQYCLVDSVGNPIICNTTGVFNNLPFGSYCINITDACADTTIKRCFTGVPPVPGPGSANITNKTCSGFTVTISGQSNIYNGLYCLLDSAGNPVTGIPCNANGVFNNVPYGSYCVKTTDGCSAAIFTNCFTVAAPVPSVGPVVTNVINCSLFQATVTNQKNLTNATFCLFDSLNNPVGACNYTGIFTLTTFGSYNIVTTDACGNVFNSPFSQYPAPSALADSVTYSNQTCANFTASVTGQVNLVSASYELYFEGGLVQLNTTGKFDSLVYNGNYCIYAKPACGDTTITRCFNIAAPPIQLTVNATPSCVFNASDLDINITYGRGPFIVQVINNSDTLVSDTVTSTHFKISGVPAQSAGDVYQIVATGYCGSPVTIYVNAQQSYLNHTYTINPKCPSSITLNGSSDLVVTATSNLPYVNMALIQKDGSSFYKNFNTHVGNDFTFSDLDNASYVIAYTFSGCTTTLYDTISLPDYQFPNLARSAAYQCDNNSFSIGASVSGGIDPFTYQIIGSSPSTPSINTPAQASPVFTITNGVEYSLVRLRATDACGNATLNDVSILPLANSIVTATSTCINQNTTLSTDDVPNATYQWYRKSNASATDSTLVGTDRELTLTNLTIADTGVYVNKMSVNSGCLTKLSYFHLDGTCSTILPNGVKLQGRVLNAANNQLNWTADAGTSYSQFLLERKKADGSFEMIASVNAVYGTTTYNYIDNHFTGSSNQYRLRIVSTDGKTAYSNTVILGTSDGSSGISIYPNPVDKTLHISLGGSSSDRYEAILFNVAGQTIFTGSASGGPDAIITYNRISTVATGTYFLKVINMTTGVSTTFKVMLK